MCIRDRLGDILFGKLGLTGGKKTSKGWSTTADILEEMADRHPIVPLVLDYRKYFKLNSTYVEALLRLVGPDGRVRTQFDQTATATGRISSNEPNLQNIPVRTAEGRQIRRAFVAGPGHVLVDADYSQIELRVLAHMSQDQTLCDAFLRGQDIHRRTAAEVYGVPIGQVTGETVSYTHLSHWVIRSSFCWALSLATAIPPSGPLRLSGPFAAHPPPPSAASGAPLGLSLIHI